jgi:hypothetical protein
MPRASDRAMPQVAPLTLIFRGKVRRQPGGRTELDSAFSLRTWPPSTTLPVVRIKARKPQQGEPLPVDWES